MFKTKPKYQLMLETEIEYAISRLKIYPVDDEKFSPTLDYVERLHEMMHKDKPSSVSRDTLAVVGANLLGILMIIKHENVNVITSKALSFVTRPRT